MYKMKKLKVITVVGTRPEIIRLSRVLHTLDFYESINHILVHTGQNYDYELNEVFFEDLGIRKPDHFLNAAGHNATTTIGNIISAIDPILEQEKPDAFLVLGDTNSCLSAIPAKKGKYLFSIWKPVIDVLISAYLKRPIERLLITSAI
jgi:UDP-N-acetylglucosamine 2-epimerase